MTRKHLPPPTKYHAAAAKASTPVQAKKVTFLSPPPRPAPQSPQFAVHCQPAGGRNTPAPRIVQRMQAGPAVTDAKINFASSVPGASWPIRLRVVVSQTKRGRDVEIYASDWDHADWTAHLHGSVEGDVAWIMTLESGRFPSGRGVGYRLVQEFAARAENWGAATCKLGTPVNTASLTKSNIPQQAGEWGAIALYTRLGFDVSTALTASESAVDIGILRQRAAQQATTKGWF